jgi:hypothetical protein
MSEDGRLELGGRIRSLQRRGVWTAPSVIRIRQRMGSIILDFRQATFEPATFGTPPADRPTVQLELDVVWASVGIRLPANGTVDTSGLAVRLGTVKDDWVDTGTTSPGPHVIINGKIIWGSLVTRRKD